jgi:hypothetical protein
MPTVLTPATARNPAKTASATLDTALYVVMCKLVTLPLRRSGTAASKIVVASAIITPLAVRITASSAAAHAAPRVRHC